MKYNILTETAFFRAAQNGSLEDMTACYGEFIERVVDVCGCKNGKTTAVATLLFAGIELKAMGKGNRMVEKAVTFISEMQKVVEQMPASEIAESAKTGLNWTGDIVNLVELMYGLQEMQCLNDGKLPIERQSHIPPVRASAEDLFAYLYRHQAAGHEERQPHIFPQQDAEHAGGKD